MNAIRVSGLSKRCGDTLAVGAIDFTEQQGTTVGLLGGNGAGKTTTVAMLLGLLVPTAGSIRILGHAIARDRFPALARTNFSSPCIALPSSHVFEGMRHVLSHGAVARGEMGRAAGLNLVWLIAASLLFMRQFRMARVRGAFISIGD